GIDGDGEREQRIEREAGERRGGKSRERPAGRERFGQDSGRADWEFDREAGGAAGAVAPVFGAGERETGRAAGRR
ncbi:hypothetical protein, partial [Methylobacterium crusticola]|uniref:hypothetical protein n=1 Tax=Methylobacterium crusticola TaxID=1697972 RepID=UPI001EE29973